MRWVFGKKHICDCTGMGFAWSIWLLRVSKYFLTFKGVPVDFLKIVRFWWKLGSRVFWLFRSVLKIEFSLEMLAKEAGISSTQCWKYLNRHDWTFYLRRKTFHLNDRKRSIRKQMAIQFERLLFEDQDFISKIFFTDETWIEFKNANDGRNGSFVPPCVCDFGDGPRVCHCEHSKSGFQKQVSF